MRLFLLKLVSCAIAAHAVIAADMSISDSPQYRFNPIPPSEDSIKTKPGSGEPLLWKKLNAQGEVARIKKLDPRKELPLMGVAIETRGGKKMEYPIRSLDVKNFTGSEMYFAEMAARVREGTMFVNILVSGTPGTDPAAGTVINVDGAFIAFQLIQNREGGPVRATIAVGDSLVDGKVKWRASPLNVAVDPASELTAPSMLCIGLNNKDNTWSLYLKDILLVEKLPLLAGSESAPTISIRAGVVETDRARLWKFRLSSKPEGRSDKYLPTEKGEINIPKAVAESDPRLRAPGELPFMAKPTRASKAQKVENKK